MPSISEKTEKFAEIVEPAVQVVSEPKKVTRVDVVDEPKAFVPFTSIFASEPDTFAIDGPDSLKQCLLWHQALMSAEPDGADYTYHGDCLRCLLVLYRILSARRVTLLSTIAPDDATNPDLITYVRVRNDVRPLLRALHHRKADRGVVGHLSAVCLHAVRGEYATAERVLLNEVSVGHRSWTIGGSGALYKERKDMSAIANENIATIMKHAPTRRAMQAVQALLVIACDAWPGPAAERIS